MAKRGDGRTQGEWSWRPSRDDAAAIRRGDRKVRSKRRVLADNYSRRREGWVTSPSGSVQERSPPPNLSVSSLRGFFEQK